MNIGGGIGLLPQFVPGEEVLHSHRWMWGASVKSLPSYRLFFLLPPLAEGGFYVTDRRIVIVTYCLRLLRFESSVWLRAEDAPEGAEIVRQGSVARVPVFGKCLEVRSEDPVKHWYRSRQMRLRFFMRAPEPLRELISQGIGG